MYKNKSSNGNNNLCGKKIAILRKQLSPKVSQRAFADKLQLKGIDLDKNAIQRIECGTICHRYRIKSLCSNFKHYRRRIIRNRII